MKTAKPISLKKASKLVTRNVHVVLKGSQLSLAGFGESVGLSRSTVRRIENAYKFKRPYNPTMNTLLKLSQATGLSIDDVVKEKLELVDA